MADNDDATDHVWIDDDDATDRVWALHFEQRVSILIMSVIERNEGTVRCQVAMLKMIAIMSQYLDRKHRGQLASALRDSADQIENTILEVA